MAFWRLLMTVVLTLVVVVLVFAAFPAIRQLFPVQNLPGFDLGNVFGSGQQVHAGNITFSINADTYEGVISSSVTNITMSMITNSGSLVLRDGTIIGKKAIVIEGFTGTVTLEKENFSFAGQFSRLELTELGVLFTNAPVNGSVNYWSLSVSDVSLGELTLKNLTGTVSAKGADIHIDDGSVVLRNVQTSIYADATLALNGKAGSITLPNSDIVID